MKVGRFFDIEHTETLCASNDVKNTCVSAVGQEVVVAAARMVGCVYVEVTGNEMLLPLVLEHFHFVLLSCTHAYDTED